MIAGVWSIFKLKAITGLAGRFNFKYLCCISECL